nr:hypothetical protein BC332_31586 [Ipomoea trifida]
MIPTHEMLKPRYSPAMPSEANVLRPESRRTGGKKRLLPLRMPVLPLHKDMIPSSLTVRLKQSIIPLYGSDKRPALIISSWFWIRSFTRSIGAAAVLETAADTPPIIKSMANPTKPFSEGAWTKTGDAYEGAMDRLRGCNIEFV